MYAVKSAEGAAWTPDLPRMREFRCWLLGYFIFRYDECSVGVHPSSSVDMNSC
jgi:hypothetical protein